MQGIATSKSSVTTIMNIRIMAIFKADKIVISSYCGPVVLCVPLGVRIDRISAGNSMACVIPLNHILWSSSSISSTTISHQFVALYAALAVPIHAHVASRNSPLLSYLIIGLLVVIKSLVCPSLPRIFTNEDGDNTAFSWCIAYRSVGRFPWYFFLTTNQWTFQTLNS